MDSSDDDIPNLEGQAGPVPVCSTGNWRGLLQLLGLRVRQSGADLTSGGSWTNQLPPRDRSNLRWFWLTGVFSQTAESVAATYLSLFALALGATRGQIGLMSSLSSLNAALFLLPGAAIVEQLGNRRNVTLITGFLIGRSIFLLLALVPLGFASPLAVYVVIGLAVTRSAFMALSLPGALSLIADITPVAWRGRYLSARNIAIGIAGMAATFLMGQLITAIGGLTGYQWALGLAFALSMVSAFSFARIQEPPSKAPSTKAGVRGPRWLMLRQLREHPGFLSFCITATLWTLSLSVAGPFFNVYLVEVLKASAGFVGATSLATGLAALPGHRLFGTLIDRWGPSRVQLITGLFIPLLPFAWAVIRSPRQMMPISLVGGFMWAGYNLASFNLLLELTPKDRRERYTALYQMVVTAAAAGGAALGGFLATRWGYATIFVVSGTGRLIAALLFAVFVHSSVRLTSRRLGV